MLHFVENAQVSLYPFGGTVVNSHNRVACSHSFYCHSPDGTAIKQQCGRHVQCTDTHTCYGVSCNSSFLVSTVLLLGNADSPGSHPHSDQADHKDVLANETFPQGDWFAWFLKYIFKMSPVIWVVVYLYHIVFVCLCCIYLSFLFLHDELIVMSCSYCYY